MFGLFGKHRKNRDSERAIPIASYGAAPRARTEEPAAFQIALGWKGLWALIAVFFLLQLWMFLIGMWAAQTIVFPGARQPAPAASSGERPARQERRAAVTADAEERPAAPTANAPDPAPVAETNLPEPTPAVPPELDGQVELGPAPPPGRETSGDSGPVMLKDGKKRAVRETTDFSDMDIPPSW